MDPQVERVLADARARGIAIAEKLGAGGYCEAWAVGDALVMRIPRSELGESLESMLEGPERGFGPLLGEHVSPTGPFVFRGIEDPAVALAVFEASIERQRDAASPHLARFVDRLELGGTPVALHERARDSLFGYSIDDRRALLPDIAHAILELHETFGFHGDLKPAHVFVTYNDGAYVTFIDPLPIHTESVLLGSIGYSLPTIVTDPANPRDEGYLLRDLAAFAAITAELHGVELPFKDDAYGMSNRHNGRFGQGWDAANSISIMRARTRDVDRDVREWLWAAFDAIFEYPPSNRTRTLLQDAAKM